MSNESRPACECEHDFVLVLGGVTNLTMEIADALFVAGCDDATPSLRSGRLYLTFSRVAPTLKEAILSAIRDVGKAGIGASVLRVDDCQLATQAEIARKTGRSRQMIHQYMRGIRGPGNFPPPACHITDSAPLWYWCEVAAWLWENSMIPEKVLREAEEVGAINSVLELNNQRRSHPSLTDEVLRALDLADPDCVPA